MFRSLPFRDRVELARWQLAGWWSRWRFYWLSRDKSNLLFYALLPLPLIVVGGMARFAYVDQAQAAHQAQRKIDLKCLAENVYFESRGEPVAGQYAVAEVTLNRVASRRFGPTICEVVHQKSWDAIRKRYVGAFSWTELTLRKPRGAAWSRAQEIATAVYDGAGPPRVDGALFYHATHIEPAWAKTMRPTATIGRHVFYR